MGIKRFKPTTPSLRNTALLLNEELTPKARVRKSLSTSLKKCLGRNNAGRITTRGLGGVAKRRYRDIDFKRSKQDIPATVKTIEYDPNRSCNIALVCYEDGAWSYIIAPLGLRVGDKIISSEDADIKTGNSKKLKNMPIGTLVHNVEMHPGAGGKISRSAGAYAQLMAKEGFYALLRMPSGELRKVKLDCRATIGQVGNVDFEQINYGKAGRMRWKGVRPSVRGVAMNPVDHPHGGGEGRTSGGRHPVTPWGMPTRGYKTRKKKNLSNMYIVKRRK